MISFNVDNVAPKKPELYSRRTSPQARKEYFEQELKTFGLKGIDARKFNTEGEVELKPHTNAFLDTATRAYDSHAPLVLSPDDVWMPIVQAVASYIHAEPEQARQYLVQFQGKQEINVEIPHERGQDLPWGDVFESFSAVLHLAVGKRAHLFDPTFSTTGYIEKAAIRVQLMNALAPYFDYHGHTLCGLPSVKLLGTQEDWASISSRVHAFGEFLPSWMHDPLKLVAVEFENASAGEANLNFWRNFVKHSGGSGGPYVSGFINAFFPFVRGYVRKDGKLVEVLKKNFTMDNKDGKSFEQCIYDRVYYHGPNTDAIPNSVSAVPMKWSYYADKFNMQLISGMFGITVYEDGFRPVIGWAVGESKEQ